MDEVKKRVFIADDEEVVLDSLKKLLILAGFDVDVTMNAKDVVPMIKKFKPDLILLDLLMPHIGGFEICEMLNSDKETQKIPIIVISALGGYTDIKKAYQLGVIGYITKPYDFTKLVEKINKAIAYKEGRAV
jgi:DNA-binding response OmpR family regulator